MKDDAWIRFALASPSMPHATARLYVVCWHELTTEEFRIVTRRIAGRRANVYGGAFYRSLAWLCANGWLERGRDHVDQTSGASRGTYRLRSPTSGHGGSEQRKAA